MLSQQKPGVVGVVTGKLRPSDLGSDEGHFRIYGNPGEVSGPAWEIRESFPEEGTSELRPE